MSGFSSYYYNFERNYDIGTINKYLLYTYQILSKNPHPLFLTKNIKLYTEVGITVGCQLKVVQITI